MGRKSCLRCKGKTLLGDVNKHFVFKSLFALLPRVNFPANNLNFHWRWRWLDRIQAIFLNLFYFTGDSESLSEMSVTSHNWSYHPSTNNNPHIICICTLLLTMFSLNTQKKPTSLDKIKKLGHVKSSLLKIVLIMSLGLKAKLEVEIVSLCSV